MNINTIPDAARNVEIKLKLIRDARKLFWKFLFLLTFYLTTTYACVCMCKDFENLNFKLSEIKEPRYTHMRYQSCNKNLYNKMLIKIFRTIFTHLINFNLIFIFRVMFSIIINIFFIKSIIYLFPFFISFLFAY